LISLLALSALLFQAAPPAPPPPLPGVLVERRLAAAVPLHLGDTLRVRALASPNAPLPFVVEGIFEREADPNRIARNDLELRFHLADLEALLGKRDRVDRFAVALAPGAGANATARWIEGVAFGTHAWPSATLANETSATFRVVSRFHDAIGIVTILASAIFLLCVMIIRVDERRRDMGMLRLIGVSRGTVFRAIVLEAVVIALLGSAVGAGIGLLAARVVNAHYAAVYDTTLLFALVTPRIVLTAALLGLVLGVVAGTLAAWRVVRTPPQRLGER
jgi:putative ABC transport system permease protein